ncbi:serine hydrolase [Bacillaceae bacterium Marseille-Q3522]|nr:serine hydrolase [Bacillaceae bacterium Marseille-Q3522]
MKLNELKQKITELLHQSDGRFSVTIEIGGERLDWNGEEMYPAASLIKLPIMMTAFLQIEQGKWDSKELVPLKTLNRVGGSGVLQSFSDEGSLPIMDLITLMIVVSDNTATNWLIDKVGISEVNQFLEKANCLHTKLNRKLMDDTAIKKKIDNFTSSQDMIKLLKQIHKPGLFSQESCHSMFAIMSKQQFQHKLPAFIDQQKMQVANKTGEVAHVEHDSAIITYKNHTAYAAVLSADLPSTNTGKTIIQLIGKNLSEFLLHLQLNSVIM